MAGTGSAQAVPAFVAQTGQACSACHVGSFGPQLTQFGRQFKMEGYTMRASEAFTPPVSVMAILSYLHSAKDQSAAPAPHYGTNDNATIDQISLFAAGGIDDHFGGFTQWTYDGVGRAFAWDNLDLRAITHWTAFGSDLLTGIGINNAPGVQDPWNSLPAWGFPYTGSDLMPSPDVGTLLDGGLAQNVLGVSAYALWDSRIYAEAALYWSPSQGFLKAMGAGGGSVLRDAAPYFRVAYQKDFGTQNFEAGAFFLSANSYPDGDRTTGTSDHVADIGFDMSYEFAPDDIDFYTLHARYTHELQHLAATTALGDASNLSDTLDDFRMDASYYWKAMLGGTIGYFTSSGSPDALLYASNRTLRPDSSGMTFQIDGTPFGQDSDGPLDGRFNLRLGLQYTHYMTYNGASRNYDGTARDAADNDALRLFVWSVL